MKAWPSELCDGHPSATLFMNDNDQRIALLVAERDRVEHERAQPREAWVQRTPKACTSPRSEDLRAAHHCEYAKEGRKSIMTPRPTRASMLRQQASADVRAEFERIESSFSCPVTPRNHVTASATGVSIKNSSAHIAVGGGDASGFQPRAARSPTRRAHFRSSTPENRSKTPEKVEWTIHAARARLAERECALEGAEARAAAQEVALEATRVSMQVKLDRIEELQEAAKQREGQLRKEEVRFDTKIQAFKREKIHMQDHIHSLQRELDKERSIRQEVEQKLAHKTNELAEEQRGRERERAEAKRERQKAEKELAALREHKERLERLVGDLQYRKEQLETQVKLKSSQMAVNEYEMRKSNLSVVAAGLS